MGQKKYHLFVAAQRETILMVFVVCLGFIFRLRQYLFNRSLWLDEAMLANNIITTPLRLLLFEKLDSEQAAPPGFILAVKAVIKLFDSSDLMIRLPAFLSGVLILVTAYFLARQALKTTIARAGFLMLISFSPLLIYYSSEFKQYSVDAFLALLLVFVGLNYKKWKFGFWIFGIAGIVVPWFSHPSVFVLTAVGGYDFVSAIKNSNYQLLKRLSVLVITWMAAFSLYYLFSLRVVSANDFLQGYWVHGFAPFPPLTLENFYWYFSRIIELAYISFQQLGPVPVVPLEGWFKFPNLFISLLIVAGSIFLFLRSKRKFAIFVGPILVAISVSILKLYPFSGRLIIFLVPIIIFIVSVLIDELARNHNKWSRFFSSVALVFIIFISINISWRNFIQPYNQHNIKGALSYLETNYLEGDVLAISGWSQPAFRFYDRFYALSNLPLSVIINIQNSEPQFISDLCSIEEPYRVWILFSHRFPERTKLLDPLGSKYPLLSSWEDLGAGVYLFDMSKACSQD